MTSKYNNRLFKIQILSVLVILAILVIILDSGGGLKIQFISIAFIFICAISNILKYMATSSFIFYLMLILFLSISSMQSIVSGVDIAGIVVWVIPLLSLPILVSFSKNVDVKHHHFILSGALFGVIVIALFIGRLTGNSILMELNEYLTSGAAGFFNYKETFFDNELPVVYFQGTLSLVFIGVLAWGYGNSFIFLISLVALILAPSRFGVTVLCAFSILYSISKCLRFKFKIIVTGLFACTVLFFSVIVVFIINFDYGVLNLFAENDPVRYGHITSIFQDFNENPLKIFTGSGPGSKFYSIGFEELTDNIEISQLELLRKYGIIFLLFVHYFIISVIYDLIRINKNAEVFALTSHYVVSLSNPVLLSVPFLIFLSYLIKEISIERSKMEKKLFNDF